MPAPVVTFNWEISFGTVLTGVSVILTLIVFHTRNVARFTKMETRVEAMWDLFLRRYDVLAEHDARPRRRNPGPEEEGGDAE